MVETTVLLCVLDGHDILYVLHHADDTLCAFGIRADGAGVGVADAMADMAVVDVGCQLPDGFRKLQDIVGWLFEQVQCKAQCRTFAHTREGGEGFDG